MLAGEIVLELVMCRECQKILRIRLVSADFVVRLMRQRVPHRLPSPSADDHPRWRVVLPSLPARTVLVRLLFSFHKLFWFLFC